MKALIVEDEPLSARRLEEMIAKIDPAIEVVGIASSVDESLQTLRSQSDIGLLLLDLHLSDGHGLDVLQQLQRKIPVIITTAYDQYALDAFQYMSVDYLLKPIKETDLRRSLAKLHHYTQHLVPWQELRAMLSSRESRKSLLGTRGKSRYPIPVKDIAFCYTENRDTWCLTDDDREYLVRLNLDQLEAALDSADFFRLNRQIICARDNVERFEVLPKSRIQVFLRRQPDFDVIVSAHRSAAFRNWLLG